MSLGHPVHRARYEPAGILTGWGSVLTNDAAGTNPRLDKQQHVSTSGVLIDPGAPMQLCIRIASAESSSTLPRATRDRPVFAEVGA
jgi:hypothetical protein